MKQRVNFERVCPLTVVGATAIDATALRQARLLTCAHVVASRCCVDPDRLRHPGAAAADDNDSDASDDGDDGDDSDDSDGAGAAVAR